MKASALFCGLVCAASAGAQYFSAGWTPGQAVSDQPSVATASFDSAKPTSLPRGAAPSGSSFDINNILTSPPIASFLERFGINITERLDQARQRSKIWDERVPLITDDNFRDLIVNEKLTEEEERQRVWFMVM
jgi:hypothetical protein